jgi:hypothetical protein
MMDLSGKRTRAWALCLLRFRLIVGWDRWIKLDNSDWVQLVDNWQKGEKVPYFQPYGPH